jgi:superfamily II DNA or RNA helicase
MQLRPYQIEAIEKLRQSIANGNKRIILCAPTGAGKTVIFSNLCENAGNKNKKVMIITDRFELLTQSGGALNRLKILPEYIQAHTTYINRYWIYVAMIETLYRRLTKPEYVELLQSIDLLIIDEAHKATFDKLFPLLSEKTIVIGATATPYRQGNQKSLHEFYTDLVEVTTVQKLIDTKYLAEPNYFGMPIDLKGIKTKGGDYDAQSLAEMYNKNKVYQGVADQYLIHAKGKKTLLFAPNIESSKQVCEELQGQGINAMHLDALCEPVERRNIINWYKHTPDAVLCNVGLFTTGFDEPTTECIILYRATQSLPLYLQMCGRGSRVLDNQGEFTILDFGNNVQRHGFWCDERTWTLRKKERKAKPMPMAKYCQKCNALIPMNARVCKVCGYEVPESKKESLERIAKLSKLEVSKLASGKRLSDLVLLIQAKKLNPLYVLRKYIADEEEARSLAKMLGYKLGWVWRNRDIIGVSYE